MTAIRISILLALACTATLALATEKAADNPASTSSSIASPTRSEAPWDLYISAVGDIMLDGSSRQVLTETGYDYPYAKVRDYFSGSQIVFGNLEGPLTDRGTPEQDKKFVFRSPPDKVAAALKNAGFNVVSLANNHMLDYGADGLAQTIDTLDTAGIQHAGAGADLMAARRPAFFEVDGKRIALLAYSVTLPENFYAEDHKAGTAFAYEDQVHEDVVAARKQADIVLVSFHWGQEGKTELRDYQIRLGHAAIDSGASAVIGHHPHILQGVEHYRNGVILYSLGNFTFGSYSMKSPYSVIAQLHFHNGQLQELKFVPINVNNFEVQFQPQPLQGEKADTVIGNLHMLSSSLNTDIHNDHGVGILSMIEEPQQAAALNPAIIPSK